MLIYGSDLSGVAPSLVTPIEEIAKNVLNKRRP
jgi:hypothetical protein